MGRQKKHSDFILSFESNEKSEEERTEPETKNGEIIRVHRECFLSLTGFMP